MASLLFQVRFTGSSHPSTAWTFSDNPHLLKNCTSTHASSPFESYPKGSGRRQKDKHRNELTVRGLSVEEENVVDQDFMDELNKVFTSPQNCPREKAYVSSVQVKSSGKAFLPAQNTFCVCSVLDAIPFPSPACQPRVFLHFKPFALTTWPLRLTKNGTSSHMQTSEDFRCRSQIAPWKSCHPVKRLRPGGCQRSLKTCSSTWRRSTMSNPYSS